MPGDKSVRDNPITTSGKSAYDFVDSTQGVIIENNPQYSIDSNSNEPEPQYINNTRKRTAEGDITFNQEYTTIEPNDISEVIMKNRVMRKKAQEYCPELFSEGKLIPFEKLSPELIPIYDELRKDIEFHKTMKNIKPAYIGAKLETTEITEEIRAVLEEYIEGNMGQILFIEDSSDHLGIAVTREIYNRSDNNKEDIEKKIRVFDHTTFMDEITSYSTVKELQDCEAITFLDVNDPQDWGKYFYEVFGLLIREKTPIIMTSKLERDTCIADLCKKNPTNPVLKNEIKKYTLNIKITTPHTSHKETCAGYVGEDGLTVEG